MLPSKRSLWSIMGMMRISPGTWQASLHLLLTQLTAELDRAPRLAIVGIGNPFRGDDAVGVLIARALAQRDYAADTDRFLVMEAGHAPENATGELRRYAPDLILFIDAAEMGEAPGAIQWVPEESIEGMSASTHSLPLSMLARYLTLELGCQVALLGIQPRANEVGEAVCVAVLQAIEQVVGGLDEAFRTCLMSPVSRSTSS